MGATNCPETPRQKMIGMMYLVLTAMLALNVSVEIINAFVTVGDSMETTNLNFAKKIENTYTTFENAYTMNPDKVAAQWDKAKQIRDLADQMTDYIDNLKYELVAEVDGITVEEAKKILETEGTEGINKKDDYTVPSEFFMGQNDAGGSGRSFELKKKLESYKKELLSLAGDEKGERLKIGLDFKGPYTDANGEEVSWETKNFYHTITVADVVVLNKFKSEVLNAEFDAINYLYSSISADDFKFDKVTARVIPKSTYVLQGGTFEAEVFVAAYDSKSKLEAEIGGQRIVGDTGMVKIHRGAGGLGKQVISGKIFVRKETGVTEYPFTQEYYVAPPAAVVSLTQMNVFYVGVDNPITVGVEGATPGSIDPVMTGGTIAKASGNSYTVRVSQPGKAKIDVYASLSGKRQLMGSYEYRCKRIPGARAVIGNVEGNGSISVDMLAASDRVMAKIPDFEFPVRLNIRSFEVRSTTPDGKAIRIANPSGGNFTPEMKDAFRKFRRGQRVLIDDIVVGKPDGSTETLTMSLRIL